MVNANESDVERSQRLRREHDEACRRMRSASTAEERTTARAVVLAIEREMQEER
jgi:hypothetical protein